MPDLFIDYPTPDTPTPVSVSGQGVDGAFFDAEGYVIPTVIPLDQVEAWLDLYDPTSSSSPSAANSRIIARAVLDALAAATGRS